MTLITNISYNRRAVTEQPEWCDCPRVDYFLGYMMAGYKISHRAYHLVAAKFSDHLFDVKLYGQKAVFSDRRARTGRGNSTFRYSAENPPPTYPSWIKRYPVWPYHKDDVAYKLMEERVQREADGTPTYDSEVYRREMRLAFESKRIGVKMPDQPEYTYPGPPKKHYFEDRPRRYGFPKTDGLKLCPARSFSWVECMAMTEDSAMCTYCGGKIG